MRALARAIVEDGISLVTEMENSDDSLTRLTNCLGPVTPSAEGDHFEVRLEIAPNEPRFYLWATRDAYRSAS